MNDALDSLNEAQKEAVLHKQGPLLILAGAGSGKTRVITHRIVNLIQNEKVHPLQICAVTFTNKAANEMRERLLKMLPQDSKYLTVKTFHSLCLLILRTHPELAQRKQGFTVYDTSLQEQVLKECIKEIGLDPKDVKPAQIANQFSSIKDAYSDPEEFLYKTWHGKKAELIVELYHSYEAKKKERNAVDFSDLLYLTVLLFKENPDILEKYNKRWKYILVDEYQDTNKIQYELTKNLAGQDKNLCVVGDDDQSIYSWRGADIRNILYFEKDYASTFTVKLEQNYRSTSTIISAASSVIQNNKNRKHKNIFSTKESGDKITLTSYIDENHEANRVVAEIKRLYKRERAYKKFAIFYRTNAQSRYFEEAIRMNSMPYKIYGGFRFYDRAEIKDLIAYLSVIVNPLDSTSLLRIINTPARGIGDTTIDRLLKLSIQNAESVLETLNSDLSDIRKNTARNLKELYFKFQELIALRSKNPPSYIAEQTIERMGIIEHFKKEESAEAVNKLENISQFINAIQEYETSTENPSLEEYLNAISLVTSEENNPDVNDYITLMTVHNSKGLEFEYVFLTGMEEGTFPHSMSIEEGNIEEERRLCYVAITRAMKKLYISHNETTKKYGMTDFREPSRFLEEIPDELFVGSVSSFEEKTPQYAPRASQREASPLDSKQRSVGSTASIKVGSMVRHKTYGEGKVKEIVGKGDNVKVKIAFGKIEKNFLLQYTQLEIIK
jgi:DNA helicase II / ATP-dependent DNA helicase PcrA